MVVIYCSKPIAIISFFLYFSKLIQIATITLLPSVTTVQVVCPDTCANDIFANPYLQNWKLICGISAKTENLVFV